ncbi:hypothetical protein MKZ38_006386 [Zalerion maritima]|uniref:U three protein 7 n=1 Tax=Zalerion maritima TaxID=339359 RepID=A0AAD5RJ61_9PEZI|nr:hypothetical protein MKZ38_006386 [Zalerion maritima]
MEVDTAVDEGRIAPEKYDNGAVAVRSSRNNNLLLNKKERENLRRVKEAHKAYGRGKKINLRNIKDKKLRSNLKSLEGKVQDATLKAKDVEILHEETPGFLEPEHELERTYRVRQEDIQENVAISTAKKRFELKLDQLGPYMCEYTRNGGDLLIAGRKGHVATMDWRTGKLGCEIQLNEIVRDVRWLHQNQFFAVAQKSNVYIYDRMGVEVHCLQKHRDVTHMEFLPYHFLLATLGTSGWLKYQDTSTGKLVTEIQTKLGPPVSATHNPHNAIMHVGHQNGTVTLWSPNSTEPLVKLLCHRGPVRSLAIDREGRYMVTGGQDQKMSVWDIRMFKEVSTYRMRKPLSSIAISETGLTATAWGTKSTIWKGLFDKNVSEQKHVSTPYMEWGGEGKQIDRLRWCPYEDVLGYGHDEGFSSIIIPGAGEANFDAFESNPFETKKQRQEGEVKSLLNKLQPEMIALNPNFVGNLDLRSQEQRQAEKDLDAPPEENVVEKVRNKARGKNSALKRYIRKQKKRNIIDDKKLKVEAEWEKIKSERQGKKAKNEEDYGVALSRFARPE